MTQKEQIKKIIYILELMTKRLKKIERDVLNASLDFFSFSFNLLDNIIILSCQACGLALAACRLLLVAVGLKPAPMIY